MSGSSANFWTHGRALKVTGAVILALGASTGGYFGWAHGSPGGNTPPSGGGGGGGSANEYVNVSAGASPSRCSPACSYDSSKAYGSINAALAAASPGDTVVVETGTYGAQTITATVAATVNAQAGTTAPSISEGGGSYTISGLTLDSGTTHGGNATVLTYTGTNVTNTNLKVHGSVPSVSITGGSGFVWNGGELGQAGTTGGQRDCNAPSGQSFGDSEPVNIWNTSNVTIENVTFYAQNHTTGASACSSNGFHLEMIRVDHDASNINIIDDTFNPENNGNDDSSTIFLTRIVGSSPTNDPTAITVENDVFGTDANPSLSGNSADGSCTNDLVLYNTFYNSPGDFACTTFTGVIWAGNIGSRASFSPCTGTHIKNIWEDDRTYTCGTDTVLVGTRGALDLLLLGGSDGYHLTSGSPAIDGAEQTNCPATDRAGATRPDAASTNCDGGAFETSTGS